MHADAYSNKLSLYSCGANSISEGRFDYPYELKYHSRNSIPRRTIELWSNYLYSKYEYPNFFTGVSYAYKIRDEKRFTFDTTQPVEGSFLKLSVAASDCPIYDDVQMYELDLYYSDSGTHETFVGEFLCDP